MDHQSSKTEQIAAEAWQQWVELITKRLATPVKFKAIIQSAIEKAVDTCCKFQTCEIVKLEDALRAARASDAEISERAARERLHGRSITILAPAHASEQVSVKALQELECIISIDGSPALQAKCHKIFAPILHESRAAHASEQEADTELVREIAQESAVDTRLRKYVVVQMTPSTWEKLQARYAALSRTHVNELACDVCGWGLPCPHCNLPFTHVHNQKCQD